MLQGYQESDRQAMNGFDPGDRMGSGSRVSGVRTHPVAHCFPAQAAARVGRALAGAAWQIAESDRAHTAFEINVSRARAISQSRDCNQRPSDLSTDVSEGLCLL
jgi:hypothetical protein